MTTTRRFTTSRASLMLAGILVSGVALFALAAEAPPELDQEPLTVVSLFDWYEDGRDWGRGAIYALLGLVGALVTTFGWIGGAVPGTAGKVELDEESLRLRRLYERLDAMVEHEKPDAAAIGAVEKAIDNLRDDLRRDRWRQFWIGFVLYVLLGAFFACALAHDLLQALAAGAGWTALLGSVGLKQEFEQRAERKNDQLAEAQSVIERFGSDPHRSVGSEDVPARISTTPERLGDLVERMSIARQL